MSHYLLQLLDLHVKKINTGNLFGTFEKLLQIIFKKVLVEFFIEKTSIKHIIHLKLCQSDSKSRSWKVVEATTPPPHSTTAIR